jgi:hypothetical protein
MKRVPLIAMLLILFGNAVSAHAALADVPEWTKVGPPSVRRWMDLANREWVAYGPQAVVDTRTVLSSPGPSGAIIINSALLVNCEKQTIAVLDARGYTKEGRKVFKRSEAGIPHAVSKGALDQATLQAACSPPEIRVRIETPRR